MIELCNIKMGRHRLTVWWADRWRKMYFRRYRHGENAGTFVGSAGPLVFVGCGFNRPAIAEKG